MSCETFNQDLEMINAGSCSSDSPLNTQFLLPAFEEDKLCPRFYGKNEEKQKVYHALKNDMHAEVQTKWGDLRCHCSRIPILRLSKTARNLNKVFLPVEHPLQLRLVANIFSGFTRRCLSIRDPSINSSMRQT